MKMSRRQKMRGMMMTIMNRKLKVTMSGMKIDYKDMKTG